MEMSCWTVYPEGPVFLEYESNDVSCAAWSAAGAYR